MSNVELLEGFTVFWKFPVEYSTGEGLPAGQAVVRKMSHKSNEYNYYWLYNSQVSDMKPLDSDLVAETFFTLQFIFMCWPLGWFMFLIFDFVSYLFRESVSTRCKK